VRIIILFMTIFLVAGCMTEIKPYLKQGEVMDIPGRIASQEKWLAQDVDRKTITFPDAKPILDKLKQIKEKYDRLRSAGVLGDKDSRELNGLLDQTSDSIFRLTQKGKKKFTY